MSGKQNNLLTKKDDIQMQQLYLSRILQYLKDSDLQSHREKHPRNRAKKNVLDSIIEYVFMKNGVDLKEFIDQLERTLIVKTLTRFNGNQKDSARFLGIKYTTLNEKIRRYNIHFRKEPVIHFYGMNLPES
jgi:DNA-binding NtrC family response regulator